MKRKYRRSQLDGSMLPTLGKRSQREVKGQPTKVAGVSIFKGIALSYFLSVPRFLVNVMKFKSKVTGQLRLLELQATVFQF